MSKIRHFKLVAFAVIAFISLPMIAFAWDSIGLPTHRQMTTDAMPLLSADEYPDIEKFRANLIEYSGNEYYSHGGNYLANGGDPNNLWDEKVKKQYKIGDYGDAYDYIGCILHLVQDKGVPAHAFDIQHVSYWAWGGLRSGDYLEVYGDAEYSHPPVATQAGTDPTGFYLLMETRTQGVVNANVVAPPAGQNWSDYWTAGNYGARWFPSSQTDNVYDIQHDALVRHRIAESINYVAGNMAAASRKLQPLVKDLSITSNCGTVPTVGTQASAQISFKILENRSKTVKIFITVDGEAIISPDYGTGKSYDLSAGASLPVGKQLYSVMGRKTCERPVPVRWSTYAFREGSGWGRQRFGESWTSR